MQKQKDYKWEAGRKIAMSSVTEPEKGPVDFARLDTITDGNKEDRNEFCNIYIKQAEESLSDMNTGLDTDNEELWKKAAHKLKGSSQTFGADPLSALCYRAELEFKAPAPDKEKMLADIRAEFSHVRDSVTELISRG